MTTDFDDSLNSAQGLDDATTSIPNARSDGHGDQFSPERVAATEARVAQTGLLEELAAWRADDDHATAGARHPLVSERAILVGLLLLASEHRALWISSVAEVFQYRLTPESRALLGLPDSTDGFAGDFSRPERWYSLTKNSFHRMLALMDPFPQERSRALTYTEVQAGLDSHDSVRERKIKTRLDEFTNGFLQMTFMQQPLHLRRPTSRIDISVEQMFIESPTHTGFARKALATRVAAEIGADPRALTRGPTDIFAGWDLREGCGWTANIAVRVDSERPDVNRFPTVAISATLSLPNVAVEQEAVSLMRAALDIGLAPGVVDADKPYFDSAPVKQLRAHASNLGFIPSTDYRADRLGVQETQSGAELIEGTAYRPGMHQRQAFAYKSPEWEEFHRHALRSSEGLHAAVQSRGRESIGEASRRAVHGFAAAQVFVTILLTNYNLRTIAAFLHRA